MATGAPVMSVAFSGDGQRLASGSFDHTAKLWSLEESDGKGSGNSEPRKALFSQSWHNQKESPISL